MKLAQAQNGKEMPLLLIDRRDLGLGIYALTRTRSIAEPINQQSLRPEISPFPVWAKIFLADHSVLPLSWNLGINSHDFVRR